MHDCHAIDHMYVGKERKTCQIRHKEYRQEIAHYIQEQSFHLIFTLGGKDTNYLFNNQCFYGVPLINSRSYHLYKQNQEYHSNRVNGRICHAGDITVHHRIGSSQTGRTGHTTGNGSQ